jgi:hypothetical protein
MRKIIGYLSDKDRQRVLEVYARAQVALSGNPNMPVQEAVRAIMEDQNLYAQLRRKYEIPEDEGVDFAASDGAIVETDD